jgi:anti-sigma-K factor RskA
VNVQEYILSGIVESYVLGLASEEERKEFEQLCLQYPELVEARTSFELSLEQQAMQYAEVPPVSLKQKIWEEIKEELQESAKIVPLSQVKVKKRNWWKVATAACIVLLAGSFVWMFDLNAKIYRLEKENWRAKENIQDLMTKVGRLQSDPNVKMASLKGMPASPQSFTTVYWDTASHDVYLLVNNLPKPPSDKQYQLWALADGQPIDLGFINDDYFIKKNRLLIQAKNAQKAQAFAITLEQKNRPNPEKPAGDMYVMGNL